MKISSRIFATFVLAGLVLSTPLLLAEDKSEEKEAKATEVKLGDGALDVTVPAGWSKIKPTNNIIEAEFQIAAAEGDNDSSRLTMMAASGGAKANIERWYGHFKQADGSSTKDAAKVSEMDVNELKVHLVDIKGDYSPPFGAKGKSENYRMLAAIIEVGPGEIYLKLIGPAKTIGENEKKFKEMVESVKAGN